MSLTLNDKFLKGFVSADELAAVASEAANAFELVQSGKGAGNDFLGWVKLPENYDKEEFVRIKAAAEKIKKNGNFSAVCRPIKKYL